MSDANDTAPERSHVTTWVVGLLILLPVLYVLSIGPVAALSTRTGLNPDSLRNFYGPVIWLHDNTPLKVPLEKWVELWGGK